MSAGIGQQVHSGTFRHMKNLWSLVTGKNNGIISTATVPSVIKHLDHIHFTFTLYLPAVRISVLSKVFAVII